MEHRPRNIGAVRVAMLVAYHNLIADFRNKYPSAIFGNRTTYSRIRSLHPDPIGCLAVFLPVESHFHTSLSLVVVVFLHRSQFRQRQRPLRIGNRNMYRTVRHTDKTIGVMSVTAYLMLNPDNTELA